MFDIGRWLAGRNRASQFSPWSPESSEPLGLRPDALLTLEQRAAFRRLAAYDLTPAHAKLRQEHDWPGAKLALLDLEFRRYIGLSIKAMYSPNRTFTMFSEEVDEVWHACLQHTMLYEHFCHTVLGRFLHHQPFTDGNPDPDGSWIHFRDTYASLYGPLHPVWLTLHPPPGIGTRLAAAWTTFAQNQEGRRKNSGDGGCGGCGCGGCGCGT